MTEQDPREHPVAPAKGPDPDAEESQPEADQREHPTQPAEGSEESGQE